MFFFQTIVFSNVDFTQAVETETTWNAPLLKSALWKLMVRMLYQSFQTLWKTIWLFVSKDYLFLWFNKFLSWFCQNPRGFLKNYISQRTFAFLKLKSHLTQQFQKGTDVVICREVNPVAKNCEVIHTVNRSWGSFNEHCFEMLLFPKGYDCVWCGKDELWTKTLQFQFFQSTSRTLVCHLPQTPRSYIQVSPA